MKWLWLSGAVVVLDQAGKALAVAGLRLLEPLPLMPGLNLTLVHNTGSAFSLLSQAGGWQRWLFVVIALVACVVIVAWLLRMQAGQVWLPLALALIAGGALGNVIDRVVLGYVIDFIDVYWRQWHWPVFNLADSAISVGACMLVVDAFRSQKDAQA